MKILCVLLALLPFFGYCSDQTKVLGNIRGAKAKECFRVVDQDGNPVEGAHFRGAFVLDDWNDYQRVEGVSNTNGEFVAEGKSKDRLHYRITKDGFYKTSGDVLYLSTKANPAVVDGKWQPYGSKRTVVLKKIIKPAVNIVHAAPIRIEAKIPEYGKWLGFDLEKYDWVSPLGAGKHEDVLLKFTKRTTANWFDFTCTMSVSFTNNPYAGVMVMKKDGSSEFVTEYRANTNGQYCGTLEYVREMIPGQKRNFSFLDDGSYLIYRTRTTVDEHQKLKTAHYGIILGEWSPTEEYMSLADGCFNPIPNDVNIEDGRYLREVLNRRGGLK